MVGDGEQPAICATKCFSASASGIRTSGHREAAAMALGGVAAHHLQHHHPVVAEAGRLQAIERLGGDGDRRRIADGALGIGDVVVDGLGDADEGEPRRHQQAAQDVEAAVAADADQPVEPKPLEAALIRPNDNMHPRAVGMRRDRRGW